MAIERRSRLAHTVPALQRRIQRLLQGKTGRRRQIAADHTLQQPRRMRQIGIEQLLDLVLGIAVAAPGNQRQGNAQYAQHQHQGTRADRTQPHALSTR
ncbi:hypothetical protein D3C78_1486660 [compost metagenome]